MKKIHLQLFSFVLCLTTVQVANGQPGITISAPYTESKAQGKHYFFKYNFLEGDEVMVLKFNYDYLSIQKFNINTPRLISTNEYKYPEDEVFPKNTSLLKIWAFNKHYYLFYTVFDEGKKINQLFCKEISFKEGRIRKDGKFLCALNINNMKMFATSVGAVADFFHFTNSSDNSKLLVYCKLMSDEKLTNKTIDAIGMFVFDENLAPEWQQVVTMPYTENKMDNYRITGPNIMLGDNNEYSIDNNGNVYIVATVFNTDKDFIKESGKDGKPNFHKELLIIKANTSKLIITPIILEGKNINRVILTDLPNNKMVCAGYYNKSKELWDADGVFLLNVNHDGELSNVKTFEIPLDVLNQFVSEGESKKNEKKENEGKAELEKVVLQDLQIEEDGSLLLIGEQALDKTYTNKGDMLSTTIYHNDNILVTKINTENKLAWMKKIPKQQFADAYYRNTGYKYLYNNGDHYFLFVDNPINENLTMDKEPEKYVSNRKGIFTAYKISDTTGEIKRESIFNTDDVKGYKINDLFINEIFQTGSNEFVFESNQKDKQEIMIKTVLKK